MVPSLFTASNVIASIAVVNERNIPARVAEQGIKRIVLRFTRVARVLL